MLNTHQVNHKKELLYSIKRHHQNQSLCSFKKENSHEFIRQKAGSFRICLLPSLQWTPWWRHTVCRSQHMPVSLALWHRTAGGNIPLLYQFSIMQWFNINRVTKLLHSWPMNSFLKYVLQCPTKWTNLECCCYDDRQSKSDGQVELQFLGEETSHEWLLQRHPWVPKRD